MSLTLDYACTLMVNKLKPKAAAAADNNNGSSDHDPLASTWKILLKNYVSAISLRGFWKLHLNIFLQLF
jgi:hypothetical protein